MGDELDTNIDESVDDVEEVDSDEETEDVEGADNSEQESDDSGDETDKEGEEEDSEGDEDEEDEEAEPPTRKPRTNADWVALRRKQKLDKARKQKEADEEQGEDDEDDDDLDSEDAKLIEKIVNKRLQPLEEERETATVKSEIDEFVATNPDFKPFAAKALKWSKHPSWKDIPTKQLMFAAAGDKLMRIGAKRSKLADEKARKTKTATGNTGGDSGKKDPWDMTDEEFEAEVQAVKSGS